MLVTIFMSLYAIALMVSTCYYHDKYYEAKNELVKLRAIVDKPANLRGANNG